MVKLELLHDIERQMNKGPKYNIFFKREKSKFDILYFIQVNLETTIDDALKYFLRKINLVEYINSKKISFRFNDTNINFGDATPVKELFGSLSTITLYVESDDQLSFNWTKEEEISFYKDKYTINNVIKELIKGIKDFQPNFELKSRF